MESVQKVDDNYIPTASFDQLFDDFEVQLDKAISHTWDAGATVEHFERMSHHSEKLSALILQIGNYCNHEINKKEEPLPTSFLIIYEWADSAKGFLVLWRNILFQQQKAFLQLEEGFINEETFQKLHEQSREVVQKAAAQIKDFSRADASVRVIKDKQIETWEKQHNPWEVYNTQIKAIPEQCKDLLHQLETLQKTSQQYGLISNHLTENLEHYQENLNYLIEQIEPVNALINDEAAEYNGVEIVSMMEQVKEKDLLFKNVVDFNAKLEDYIDELPNKQNISIDSSNGVLLYKDLDLNRTTNPWLESEIRSIIYDFYNIKDGISNKLKITSLNIKNRVDFEKQEGQQPARKDIIAALKNLLATLNKSKEDVAALKEQIIEKTTGELKASNVYKPNFLSVSMSSTINQYRRYQTEGWERARNWIAEKGLFVKQFQKSVRQEEMLSASEKIVRTVRHRTPQPENTHYTNMFLTKGYIGDSFWVGRKDELARINLLIENWKLGYGGALMITGKRFSGKTLMGTLISNEHFPDETIHLKPKQKIQVGGRQLDAGHDLKEALDFVIKYSLQTPAMVWIDDLVLWKSDQLTLSENIQHLLHTIDQYSGRLLFVVSMSNWLKAQLSAFFEIDKVFQSEINTDKLSVEEVKEAILIRHNATQMNLVQVDGEDMDASQLDKIVKQLYRSSEGNIGEVLRRWSYTLDKYNEEQVFPDQEPDYSLPDFMSTNAAILLRTIMMEKYTTEYFLRKQLGPAFKDTYQALLQRFFNLGILHRRMDNTLEINPYLVNDIGKMLERNVSFGHNASKVSTKNNKI